MTVSQLTLNLTERQFMTRIIDRASARSWRLHHCRPARRSDGSWSTPIQGDAGFCDVVIAKAGFVVFAECKSERGRLTDAQGHWLAELSGTDAADWLSGDLESVKTPAGLVAVWRPSAWSTIEAVLDAASPSEILDIRRSP